MDDTRPDPEASSPMSGMSVPAFQALVRAYKAGAAKFTLVILAENMAPVESDDGREAWWEGSPTVERLADETEQGVRTVRRHLTDLEAAGAVGREPRYGVDGRQISNVYVIRSEHLAVLASPPAILAARPATAESSQALTEQEHEPSAVAARPAKSAAPPPAARRGTPNPIWDAVVEVCHLDARRMTSTERGHIGRIVKELKQVEALPDEIRAFSTWWTRTYPGARLTPPTITKHWSAFRTAATATAARDGYRAAPWLDYA